MIRATILCRILPRLEFRAWHDGSLCWLWTGSLRGGQRRRNGPQYGQIWIDGANHYVHRLVFLAFKGYLPDVVGHEHGCGRGRCVNPGYLFDQTRRENARRAAAKTNLGDPDGYDEGWEVEL